MNKRAAACIDQLLIHPQLGGFLPGGAIDVAREQLTRIASKGSQALGLSERVTLERQRGYEVAIRHA
jgi:hypothetical protein